MYFAAKLNAGLDHGRGEAFVLASCRGHKRRQDALGPGLGCIGVLNYRASKQLRERGILHLAIRGWNGCGLKLHMGKVQLLLAVFWLGLSGLAPAQTALPRAHAHNDYAHPRPLLDALEHGFCSVEADIHLVNGQLLVGHDPEDLRPERNLEKLYLDPLRERAKKNSGQVVPGAPGFTLMIDIKTEAQPTYEALTNRLEDYSEMLTVFGSDSVQPGAVTVIVSGNRPISTITAEPTRWVALDGRLAELAALPPASVMPIISDNWTKHFSWRGKGPLPAAERDRLTEWVQKVHQEGRRLRFWATPDTPEAWTALHEAGVDLINTDRLSALRTFLEESAGKAAQPKSIPASVKQ